jgi:ABC-type bacteriocin/lantibiotic exporter with double-glycine peptidase domain
MKKGILFQAKAILLPSHKKKGVFIVMLLALSSLLDFISLASFLPIILLIINPEENAVSQWLINFFSLKENVSRSSLTLILTVAVLLFIVLKTQINVWITHKKAIHAYKISSDLASLALTQYLKSPYLKFTNTDYTREMNRISNLPLMFANNIVIPIGTLLSEALLLTMFFICIAIYDIKVLLFLMLVIAPIALLYRMKRKKMSGISEEVKIVYPRLLKYTLQAIEGLTEIRVFRKESFFKNRFNKAFTDLSKIFSIDHVANTSALRATELIAALSVGMLIIYALIQRKSYHETIVLLSIYAGISSRAIPAINRIFSASLQMKSHEYILSELQNMLAPEDDNFENIKSSLPFHHKIELRNISFSYQGQSEILKDVSLTIHKGERVVFTGQSGTGKTSLFLILMRFVLESSGDILVDEKKLTEDDALRWRKLIGYVPQNPFILDATILENIAFGVAMEKIDVKKVMQLIQELDLGQWLTTLPDGALTIIGEKGARISGGQRQRLAIARALYHDSEILLLDEITNQLDTQTEIEVLHALNNFAGRNKTIILITHRAELWKSFDTIYELRAGKFYNITKKETLAG